MGASAWLYRMHDAAGRLLYVGVTSRPRARMAAHARLDRWAADVDPSSTSWTQYASRADVLRAESVAIAREDPRHNVSGVCYRRQPISVATGSVLTLFGEFDADEPIPIGPARVRRLP